MITRLAATILLVIFAASTSAHAQTQHIIMAVSAPQSTPIWRGAEAYRDAVNKQLDGKASLVLLRMPDNALLEALHMGKVDMAVISSSRLASSKSTRLALFDMPFFFKDLRETVAVQNSLIGEVMLGSVTADGMVGLAYWNMGMSQLFGSKLIEEANQLQGIRLRTTVSAPAQTSTQGLGVKTVQVAFGDVPDAISKGQIDLIETLPLVESIIALKPMYYTNVNYRPIVTLVVANAQVWEKMTLRVQTALVEQARAIAARVASDAQETQDAAARSLQERFKFVTIDSSKFLTFSEAAVPGWRSVTPLTTDDFLEAALNTRAELRRIKLDMPQKRTDANLNGNKITINFATDRRDEKDPEPEFRFGGARGSLKWGQAEIVMDPNRPFGVGDTDSVRLNKLIDQASPEEFASVLRNRLAKSKRKELLIYVHGFRNTFKMAVESAAQIVADTKFQGVPFAFSWPSQGSVFYYPSDEEEVQASRNDFISVLKTLSGVAGLEKIHVITHSMGGRLASYSFDWLASQATADRPPFYNIILAAPDIRNTLFEQTAPSLQKTSKRVTLYASKWDQALLCSLYVHQAPRAGQAGESLVVRRDLQTIDASAVEEPSWLVPRIIGSIPCTPLGHSYISQNPAVLSDLFELLSHDTEPNSRQRLHEQTKGGLRYWIIR